MASTEAPDIGRYHLTAYRFHRALTITTATIKVIGTVFLSVLGLIAFICHEYERANRHRMKH